MNQEENFQVIMPGQEIRFEEPEPSKEEPVATTNQTGELILKLIIENQNEK